MRDEVPAALPLLVFAVALAAAPHLEAAAGASAGLLTIAILLIGRPRLASASALAAVAILIGAGDHNRRSRQQQAVAALDRDRFITVEAPIERDWSVRPHYSVLRSSSFRAGAIDVDAGLSIYVRFAPAPIEMESVVRAEGHLRADGRGGYALSVKSARLLSYRGALSPWSPAAWNRAIANRLRAHAVSRPHDIAMIEALLLGRGERLSDQAKEDFRRGGTYHLLVFSGLQISLAGAAIALLLRWIGAPRAADWSLLLFSLLAPAFIGHEASVSRASSVIALFAISRIIRRPTSPENLWCVAAIARLAFVPRDLFDPAFHLTYAGAGALLFIGAPLARTRLRWLAYAIAAEIAIVPLTLFHFHQYAVGGSLATVVMTPVVFIMLLLGALFAATEAIVVLDLISSLNVICNVINALAAGGSGFFAAPPGWTMSIASGGALAAVAFARGVRRTAMVILLLILPLCAAVVTFRSRVEVAEPRLTMLDVGQGEAILVRSRDRTLLVDGGGRHGDLRFGDTVLLPLLLERGVRRIDIALLTHAHPDHCIGLVAAIRHLDVGEVWISPRRFRGTCAHLLLEAAQERATPIRLLGGGERLQIGDIGGRVLLAGRRYRRAPENNHSVILALTLGGRDVLLTGDIERDAERDLVDRLAPADIIKIPHHGSRTSTSPALLAATRPRIALISCGRNNVFGHPHRDVLDALASRHVRVARTDLHGTVEVVVKGGVIKVRRQIDTPG